MIFLPAAYFLLNVALNHESDVITEIKNILRKIKSIDFEIQGVFGIYDVVVKVSSDNEDDIRRTAITNIRSIEHIQSAITMFVNDD